MTRARSRCSLLAAWILGVVAAAASPGRSMAQAPALADSIIEARTTELARQLRCPVCQGLSIQDSPTELSHQMRATIREQLRAGRSPEEVKAYFVARYGEWILLRPEPHGFNLSIYLLPWLVLLAGAVVVFWVVRKWTRNAPPEEAAGLSGTGA